MTQARGWAAALRDPLLHFVVAGAAIFALGSRGDGGAPADPGGEGLAVGEGADGAVAVGTGAPPAALGEAPPSQGAGPSATTMIEVSDAVVDVLRRQLEVTHARAPTDDELERAVDSWLATEVLVREARALGLDRDDVFIRDRLAELMSWVVDASGAPLPPTDAQLLALFEAHRDEYTLDTRLTLRQTFVPRTDPDAVLAAQQVLRSLETGLGPARLAAYHVAPHPDGPVLRGRTPERLAERYGDAFVGDLLTRPVGTYGLHRSQDGWHVVLLEARREGRALTFDEARDRLVAQWTREQHVALAEAAHARLRERYTVVGWPR